MAQKQASTESLKRKAISSSGNLGDFYDIHTDRWVEKCDLTRKGQPDKKTTPKILHCKLLIGNTPESRNLFDLIGVENELQVNLLLNIAPTVGIGEFINYPRKIDDFTRIIYYSYHLITNMLLKDNGKEVKRFDEKKIQPSTTHIVSKVDIGIDAIIILQLRDNANVASVDDLLKKFCKKLSDVERHADKQLEKNDQNILKQILNVTIYSNVPKLTQINRFSEILSQIDQIRKNGHLCRPIRYYLQPIAWFYSQYTGKAIIFHSLPSNLSKTFEELHDLRILKNDLEIFFKRNDRHVLNSHLKDHVSKLSNKWEELTNEYDDFMTQLSDIILEYRKSEGNLRRIEKILNNGTKKKLWDDMLELLKVANKYQAKAKFINDLRVNKIEYRIVKKTDVVKSDDIKDLEQKLIKKDHNEHALCSTDQLNEKYPERLIEHRADLIHLRQKDNTIRPVYIDFSYCDYELSKIIILSSSSDNSNQKKPERKKKTRRKTTPRVTQKPPSKQYDTINILLLGESGVGKSTFINAFANYLTSETFQEAKRKDPTVVITASFLITTGEDFEEHIIKIVDFDNSNNEDFDHPGQSATQQCRSYVFPIHENNEKKVRIIDTPGFGDTRGLNQDDINIEHILQFVNNLTHLDAICFLCKPNSSRLNVFFRGCIMRLFSLLDSNAQQNILFCFTNARSTFYTPGDSAPLIMEMLRSLPNNNIIFQKKNVFCFDNESFRYLVALRHGITFNELDEREYETSWMKSVDESNRLLNYVKNLSIYNLQEERQTNKHAQITIELLIRPILETIRNSQRNLLLQEKNIKNQWIDLCPKHLDEAAFQCHGCRLKPIKIGQFSIIPDCPHKITQNECINSDCSCTLEKHKPMYYRLDYEIDSENSILDGKDDLQKICSDLWNASAEFAYQFQEIEESFNTSFIQMIEEEHELNQILNKKLREIYSNYQIKVEKLKSMNKKTQLSNIYKLIDEVTEYEVIEQQMKAVKQTQEFLMEKCEYIVH